MNWSLVTPEQKSHVFDQLVDINLQLEDLPMPTIGRSIFKSQTESEVAVGPVSLIKIPRGQVFLADRTQLHSMGTQHS